MHLPVAISHDKLLQWCQQYLHEQSNEYVLKDCGLYSVQKESALSCIEHYAK